MVYLGLREEIDNMILTEVNQARDRLDRIVKELKTQELKISIMRLLSAEAHIHGAMSVISEALRKERSE